MNSFKRRRSINIDASIIDKLRIAAKTIGESHTRITSQILMGEVPPLLDAKFEPGSRKSVSMTESLWLALKEYAAAKYPEESYTATARKILFGQIPPVSQEFIELGLKRTKEREEKRKNGEPEEAQLAVRREECRKKRKREERKNHLLGLFARIKEQSNTVNKDPIAVKILPKQIEDEKIEPDKQSEIAILMRREEDEERRKRRERLSKGSPIEPEYISTRDANRDFAYRGGGVHSF